MPDLATLPYQLVWPFSLALTWMLGEILYARTGLPRISIYGIAGFVFGKHAASYLSPADAEILLLIANLAFGLILFELGYRINLRWLQRNPWLLLTALVEAIGTAGVVLVTHNSTRPDSIQFLHFHLVAERLSYCAGQISPTTISLACRPLAL